MNLQWWGWKHCSSVGACELNHRKPSDTRTVLLITGCCLTNDTSKTEATISILPFEVIFGCSWRFDQAQYRCCCCWLSLGPGLFLEHMRTCECLKIVRPADLGWGAVWFPLRPRSRALLMHARNAISKLHLAEVRQEEEDKQWQRDGVKRRKIIKKMSKWHLTLIYEILVKKNKISLLNP